MAKRDQIRKKIQARKAEKVAAEYAKFAKMRQVAQDAPGSIEKDLTALADSCAKQAEAFDALRENLDLIQAPKEASLKVRTAAARQYAKEFKRIAEEAPQELASALSEAYHSLDEQAGALEQIAEHLGIDLGATPVEEAFAEEGIQEMDEADEKGVAVEDVGEPPFADADVEDKEAAGGGSDAFVTDRGNDGQPKKPEEVKVPRLANSGPGGAGFVTDRDKDAKPARPTKLEIPQAQGEAAKKSSDGSASAEAFVKDIPQSQGKTEVGAGKQGKAKPMTQIVSGGTPAPPAAAEFVKDIPQSQGSSESPGNKAGSRKPMVKVVRKGAGR
jgi:hypothetical protein